MILRLWRSRRCCRIHRAGCCDGKPRHLAQSRSARGRRHFRFRRDRVAELREEWGSGPPNCLIVPNFSIGAVVMMRLSEIAAPHFAAAEVIEMHHDRKATRLQERHRDRGADRRHRIAGSGGRLGRADSGRSWSGRRRCSGSCCSTPGIGRSPTGVVRRSWRDVDHPSRHQRSDCFHARCPRSDQRCGELPDPVTVGLESVLGI